LLRRLDQLLPNPDQDSEGTIRRLAQNSVMTFGPGDLVHVAALGKGIVREVRNGGRYLVEIKGRALVVAGSQLAPSASARLPRRAKRAAPETRRPAVVEPTRVAPSLDLHDRTVPEGLDALMVFLNTALLAGDAEVRVIHGRSGGRLKAAVHAQLKRMSSIRDFGLDPRNPGVTIVWL
jgi:dsDNA-specific endonuclease/ATPase MutS2